jgi:hypothetical protein
MGTLTHIKHNFQQYGPETPADFGLDYREAMINMKNNF